ncbi:MAG: hypothetical protein IKJ36_02485 [Clostridia bacterium]|nr:hypothetical protein [Clostridia bacterium]
MKKIILNLYIEIVRVILNKSVVKNRNAKITQKISVFLDNILNKYYMVYDDDYKRIRESMKY